MRWWDSGPRLTDYEQQIVDNVARYGWHCTSVVSEDRDRPGFSYTIGLWESLGTPELILFGLDGRLSHHMLSGMVRQLEAGAQLTVGRRWQGILGEFDCVSRPVHPTRVRREFLNSAMWYRRHRGVDEPLPVYQLFWPGEVDRLFPWDRDCDPKVRALQPLLYLPDEVGMA